MMRPWRTLAILLMLLVLEACGMHLRGTADLPSALHTMHFKPENPNDAVALLLERQLKALGVTLLPSATKGGITLALTKSSASNTQPAVGLTTYAMNYQFSLSVRAQLLDSKGGLIRAHRFVATNELMLNLNQIYIINQTTLAQGELQRELVNRILFWLSAQRSLRLPNQQAKTAN